MVVQGDPWLHNFLNAKFALLEEDKYISFYFIV